MSKKNTATILSIKVDKKVRDDAKRVATELGLTLTAVVNACLKQFIREKSITLSMYPQKPSKEILELLKK